MFSIALRMIVLCICTVYVVLVTKNGSTAMYLLRALQFAGSVAFWVSGPLSSWVVVVFAGRSSVLSILEILLASFKQVEGPESPYQSGQRP